LIETLMAARHYPQDGFLQLLSDFVEESGFFSKKYAPPKWYDSDVHSHPFASIMHLTRPEMDRKPNGL